MMIFNVMVLVVGVFILLFLLMLYELIWCSDVVVLLIGDGLFVDQVLLVVCWYDVLCVYVVGMLLVDVVVILLW